MAIELTSRDRYLLDGEAGAALAMAMRILVRVAEAMGANDLLDIAGAHIDSCLYHGQVGVDFVERFVAADLRVVVPTTLNVASLDLLHPGLFRGDAAEAASSRRLMRAYEALGCSATWTCAPYQLESRPGFGEQVAWAESNAIVFANSVLGARTHRYGDFVDICAALTGRAPAAGLHLTENRRAEVVFDVSGIAASMPANEAMFPALGLVIGSITGTRIPAIVGLPHATEDQLKALGAAAASAGAVGMFHVIGITPEAPDLETALHGRPPLERHVVTAADIRQARDRLTTAVPGEIGAVSVGTPHASLAEVERLAELLAGRRVHPSVEAYVSTGRDVALAAADAGLIALLEQSGVAVVTDTCTYITPILRSAGPVMTNSAKWAYYAPANIGVEVVFGALPEVVESAVAGRVVRDETLWQ